jgi:hypothetical protein
MSRELKKWITEVRPNAVWDLVKLVFSGLIAGTYWFVEHPKFISVFYVFVGSVALLLLGRLTATPALKKKDQEIAALHVEGGRPKQVISKPNICCFATSLVGVEVLDSGGMTEVPMIGRSYREGVNAVLARFENEFSETAANVDGVCARLIFKRGNGGAVLRVDHGCWLEEDFNWTYFDVGTIRSLVLCGVSVPERGKPSRVEVPDDRRESTDRYSVLGQYLRPDEYDVDVVLNYGSAFRPSIYRFKLDIRDPADTKIEILKAR